MKMVISKVTKSGWLTAGGEYEVVSENDTNFVVKTDKGIEIGFSKGYFKDASEDPFAQISGWCFLHGIGEADQGTLKILVEQYADAREAQTHKIF